MTTTRFAPSPTGELHLGGLRTALFSYALAKQSPAGRFLLRIEDTDASRTVPGAESRLRKALHDVGLRHDGEVVRQSERLPIYREHAARLVKSGAAYPCFCSPDRLDLLRKTQAKSNAPTGYDGVCSHLSHDEAARRVREGGAHTIRLRAPKTGETVIKDQVVGSVRFDNRTMDDQVLIKSDGWPTYHLASVVDDKLMGVTHVVRGDEWLSSTPKHAVLHDMFSWTPPTYAHLPLLLTPDGKKLSKRSAMGTPVQALLAQGYLPFALVNFCALLGWAPPPPTNSRGEAVLPPSNVMPPDQFYSLFSLQGVTRSAAVADPVRLGFFNAQHIRMALQRDQPDWASQLALIESHVATGLDHMRVGPVEPALMRASMDLLKDRVRLPSDFVQQGLHLFMQDVPEEDLANFPDHVVQDPDAAFKILQTALGFASQHRDFGGLADELGLAKGTVLSTLRWALTGQAMGAPIPDTCAVLGKERVASRLQRAAEALVQLMNFSAPTSPR
jgi:glutamyl-tRNA synthetase